MINPDPMNVASVHLYGSDHQNLPDYVSWSKKVHKPLFVGEFGVETKDPDRHSTFEKLLNAIE